MLGADSCTSTTQNGEKTTTNQQQGKGKEARPSYYTTTSRANLLSKCPAFVEETGIHVRRGSGVGNKKGENKTSNEKEA